MNAAVPSAIEAKPGGATSVLRTLVVCDLVDSTALVERLGDQRGAELFRKHDRLARTLMQQHGGTEIDKTDGFLLIFDRPIQAVAFALAYQRELKNLGAQESANLAARIGIHIGDVVVWENAADDVQRGAKRTEVEGLVKPVAARLMQLALPRQILLSGVAYDIAHRAQGELGEKLQTVRWRTHGRYRFKGVPDLVPVFEVGDEDIAPLKPPSWSGKAYREMPFWRRPVAIGVELALLALLIAVPIFYLARPEPAIAFANRDWVVVGDLKNLTGEKVFDDSLQSAFRIGLEQSRYVNVVPDLQVRDALKRMQRDPATTHVDRATGAEIAEREGARALILPTIAEIGGHVRLTAEIVDPRTQTSVYSDSVDGSGNASVMPSMDALLEKMRARLGESLASIGEASAPLAQITTGNLDALRASAKAEGALGAGQVNEAILLWREALRIDPDFAMAWARLATCQLIYQNDAKSAYASLQRAQALRNRLSTREQLYLDGVQARFGDASKWIDSWTVAAQLYPDLVAAQNNLGYGLLLFEHKLGDAAQRFTAVANSRHPLRAFAWYSLALIATEQGDYRKAVADVAEGRKLGTWSPKFEDVLPDLAQRDYPAVLARLNSAPASLPPPLQAEKDIQRAAVEVDQGHGDAADQALDLAAQASARVPAAAARIRLAQVALALSRGDAGARKALAELVAGESKRASEAGLVVDGSAATHLALAAMLAARANEPKLARSALDAVRSMALDHGFYDRAALWRTADCETQFISAPRERSDCLGKLIDGREYTQTHAALMLAEQAAGDATAARAQAQWLLQHRGQAVAELESQRALIPNLLLQRQALALTQAPQQGAARDAGSAPVKP